MDKNKTNTIINTMVNVMSINKKNYMESLNSNELFKFVINEYSRFLNKLSVWRRHSIFNNHYYTNNGEDNKYNNYKNIISIMLPFVELDNDDIELLLNNNYDILDNVRNKLTNKHINLIMKNTFDGRYRYIDNRLFKKALTIIPPDIENYRLSYKYNITDEYFSNTNFKPDNECLGYSCYNGNIEEIDKMIKSGINPEILHLKIACQMNDIKLIKYFIENFNIVPNIECLKLLVEKYPTVNYLIEKIGF